MSERSDTLEPQRRPRRGPQPLARDAGALLKHHLSARGFAQIEIVTRWSEIAGRGLAAHCFPYRLSQGGASGATLTLVADDRAALELQHQAPKLLDKINSYFGRTVASKIKVVAGDVAKPGAVKGQVRALSAAEVLELERQASAVRDPALRDALTRLGRHALAESRKPPVYKR